ncbi:endonuclease VII [Xylella phage Paz]|uniref:DNA endonuclease VII n=1 Tax=Xylella phage Paz TaxID=1415145 RepID=V5Q7J7_9CAUD|nr:endonuclease VII [Xylella phage Paz]AHB12117.1 DNA endonuclease VII [Xylella phage Paz]
MRARIAEEQGGRCKLCQGKLGTKAPLDPVLDHDHLTGAVRGVLHRGCNSLLGKVENNALRYGVHALSAFCHGLAPYFQAHVTNITNLLHPTFKTADEKRLARNAKARKARANKKDTA